VTAGRRSAGRVETWAVVAVIAAVLWQVAPLYRPGFATEAIVGTDTYRSHDWLEVAKLDFYARQSILDHGRLPWWNPLLAGGTPQVAHPSDGSAGPMILSSLVFGETLGMKLNIGLVALLGALGVFLLLRRVIGVGPTAAAVGAIAYAWSGWLPSRVAVGFYESCLMAAWPMVLALWLMPGERRQRRRRWTIGAVLLWALAIQLQLALPVLVLLMATLALCDGVQRRLRGEAFDRPVLLGGAALLLLAGLLGGVKFVPMLDLLGRGDFREARIYPTHPDAWYRNFDQLLYALFHRVPQVPLYDRDGGPRVQEYMTLLPGLGALLLAPVGVAAVLREGRRHAAMPWLVAGAVFLWLSFGPWAPIDGFRALHTLPLFGSMRGPLRYFNYPVLLSIQLLAGVGFAVLAAELSDRGRWVAAAVAVLLCLPASLDGRALYVTAFAYAAEELPPQPRWQSEGLRGRSAARGGAVNLRKYGNVRRGVPTVYVPEDIPIEVAATPSVWVEPDGALKPEPTYSGEVRLVDAGAGTAAVIEWLPNELVTGHSLSRPTTVVLNQNAWAGWTCGGAPARAVEGRLAFQAAAGEGATTICRWRPPGRGAGLALSLLGLLGAAALWPWRGPRPGRREAR